MPRTPENDSKSDPGSQDEKRTEPRRSQDRLGPPTGSISQYPCAPGTRFGRPKRHQNRPQTDQKSKRKFKTKKKRPKTILDPSWSDLGSILPPFWDHCWHFCCGKLLFVNIYLFEDKTVRRRFRDQFGPKKAPTSPKMTPKRGPRSSPKRPKIDIEIDMNFDANPKGR